jgi:hypothetical protein
LLLYKGVEIRLLTHRVLPTLEAWQARAGDAVQADDSQLHAPL